MIKSLFKFIIYKILYEISKNSHYLFKAEKYENKIIFFLKNNFKEITPEEILGRKIIAKAGKHTFARQGFCVGNDKTTIGAFTSIGMDVKVSPGVHPLKFLSTHPLFYLEEYKYMPKEQYLRCKDFDCLKEGVHIGNDVWIGTNVTILDGINIGDGAVVGGGAVVTKDVPPYAIVAGCPAKIIRYRFSEDIIQQLLELKWWDLSDAEISKLPFDNIEECIKELHKIRETSRIK